LIANAATVDTARLIVHVVPDSDVKSLQALGDALREQMVQGVAVLATTADGKGSVVVVVSDDLRDRGVRADAIVRGIAMAAGCKPHIGLAGMPDASRLNEAREQAPVVLRGLLDGVA